MRKLKQKSGQKSAFSPRDEIEAEELGRKIARKRIYTQKSFRDYDVAQDTLQAK